MPRGSLDAMGVLDPRGSGCSCLYWLDAPARIQANPAAEGVLFRPACSCVRATACVDERIGAVVKRSAFASPVNRRSASEVAAPRHRRLQRARS